MFFYKKEKCRGETGFTANKCLNKNVKLDLAEMLMGGGAGRSMVRHVGEGMWLGNRSIWMASWPKQMNIYVNKHTPETGM